MGDQVGWWELTEDQQRDLQRRMEVVKATAAAVEDLFEARQPIARDLRRKEEQLNQGSLWATLGIGILLGFVGHLTEIEWLKTGGIMLLAYFGIAWLGFSAQAWTLQQKIDALEWRIWEQRDRWRANGGSDSQFNKLLQIHREKEGPDLDALIEWEDQARRSMLEKATLHRA